MAFDPPGPDEGRVQTVRSGEETGHPFLDFVNTVSDDGKTRAQNSFADGAELLGLLRAAGMPIPADETPPSRGQMASLMSLREAAHAVLSAMAAKRRPGREEALMLESAVKSATADATLTLDRVSGASFRPGPLGGLHDVVALSALDLLTRADLTRLKECKRCTRLFLDHGRGPGRRWCAMSRCGNRAKAESFRARKRAGDATG
ncbi:CGNR zinc finger domain-containing protein [Roseibacterium beibuensis]|uniref:CGNR zinc finger domain-containing protein n=2 Tax=[Roseibacterium] beibuensis TaxID=1193142 RepID=A0ABP9LPD7_9RHOB